MFDFVTTPKYGQLLHAGRHASKVNSPGPEMAAIMLVQADMTHPPLSMQSRDPACLVVTVELGRGCCWGMTA